MRAFEFEMTAERARGAAELLERALWRQNDALEARIAPHRGRIRVLAMAVNTAGFALAVYAFLVSHSLRYGLWVAVFMLTAVVFYYLPEWIPAMRRFARRSLARAARRMMARVEAKAPYRIQYALDDRALSTTADAVGVRYALGWTRAKRVIVSGWVVCVFAPARRQMPVRVLYAVDAADREALVGAFERAGAEVIRLEEAAAPAAA